MLLKTEIIKKDNHYTTLISTMSGLDKNKNKYSLFMFKDH